MAVAGNFWITGTNKTIVRMNREIAKIRTASSGAMLHACLVVKADSVRRTPVDTGNLRGSASARVSEGLEGPMGTIAYSASYAIPVHERNANYRAPGTGWKFLERALAENHRTVLAILRDDLKI